MSLLIADIQQLVGFQKEDRLGCGICSLITSLSCYLLLNGYLFFVSNTDWIGKIYTVTKNKKYFNIQCVFILFNSH
ncbi:hypothetical protein AB205_0081910 [Aquarana catesbeiana]|uniref:Uncharacterized protein n=1 Tax=Aquarana catesbeiana TaxID=8400 RepID=A0A2G9RGT3_AQUCT|nr:hypothetical protein AB205_0081910 [Aquarana catesbeiana]